MHASITEAITLRIRNLNRSRHGLDGRHNGALLGLEEDRFDVFVTTDKNLRYQQNLAGKQLAIVQLPTNQVPVVASLAPAVKEVLASIKPGEFVEIPFP